MWSRAAPAAPLIALAACRAQPSAPRFPSAHRDVAPIVGDAFSTEDARDRVGEAEQVMELAAIKPGMPVADVGANRPVKRHGIPPRQLQCEFAALGMTPVRFEMLAGGEVYLMAFRPTAPKPAPEQIRAC